MKLVFLHIPKTAGSSMRAWFGNAFGPENMFWQGEDGPLEALDVERQAQVTAFGGHFQAHHPKVLELEETFGRENITYLVIVRDPLFQVCSHYNYIRRKPEHPEFYEEMVDYQILLDKRFFAVQSNLQCHYLTPTGTWPGVLDWMQSRRVIIKPLSQIGRAIDQVTSAFSLPVSEFPIWNASPNNYDHLIEDDQMRSYVEQHCHQDYLMFKSVSDAAEGTA